MLDDQFFSRIIFTLGPMPLVLVCIVAGIACIVRIINGQRNGWTVIAAVGFLLAAKVGVSLVFDFVQKAWPGILPPFPTDSNYSFYYFIAITVILPTSILQAAAWGLILYAAFGPGSGPKSRYLVEE